MVRLSMTTVRPSLPALAEEVRLKVGDLIEFRLGLVLTSYRSRCCRFVFTLTKMRWTFSSACPASSHLRGRAGWYRGDGCVASSQTTSCNALLP